MGWDCCCCIKDGSGVLRAEERDIVSFCVESTDETGSGVLLMDQERNLRRLCSEVDKNVEILSMND